MGVPREVGKLYRVGELLGTGATGSVYAGESRQGEQVAIKFLHEHFTEDPAIVARFQREARIAARIESDHVAPVIASGRTAGIYWIAYKRLHGETLEARLQRERVVSVAWATRVVEHVLAGLKAAHAAGIVHRDIKPANIFLQAAEGGDHAYILDFGVSKYRGGSPATSPSLTSDTDTLGSVSYMAPEQVGGAANVDGRADLYAVGVVAFRMLTGKLPFDGGLKAGVLHAKLTEDAPSLATVSGVPWRDEVEGFFRTALHRHAEARFKDAEAVWTAWSTFAQRETPPSVGVLRSRLLTGAESEGTLIDPPESVQ